MFYLTLFLTLVISTSAFSLSIKDIDLRIKEERVDWTASSNNLWNLPRSEKIKLLGLPLLKTKPIYAFYPDPFSKELAVPNRLDWRNRDGIDFTSPVTNQGKCGSCVAFAVVGTMEGQINVTNSWPNLNMNFSEQHLFACGSGKCSRGWTLEKGSKALKVSGVPDEACLPYSSGSTGKDVKCSKSCPDNKIRSTKINSYKLENSYWYLNVKSIVEAINRGPVLTRMDVYEDFMAYKSGIYRRVTGGKLGGHAVVIVGYDLIKKYWIVRNSWGANWGEDGYFKIYMDDKYTKLGYGSYSYQIEPFGGALTITSPNYREVISGDHSFDIKNSFEDVKTVVLKIGDRDFKTVKRSEKHFTTNIDTTSISDGVYETTAHAGAGKSSQIKRVFILNNSPTTSIELQSPKDGATLKKRVYLDFKIDSTPIPATKLVVYFKGPDGRVTKAENDNPASRTFMSWKTNLVANGMYKVWGVAYTGNHKKESDRISVTVKN